MRLLQRCIAGVLPFLLCSLHIAAQDTPVPVSAVHPIPVAELVQPSIHVEHPATPIAVNQHPHSIGVIYPESHDAAPPEPVRLNIQQSNQEVPSPVSMQYHSPSHHDREIPHIPVVPVTEANQHFSANHHPPNAIIHDDSEPTTDQEDHTQLEYPLPMHDLPDEEFQQQHEDLETFIPDSVVTVTIPGGKEEFFYQDIDSNPTTIRGGFFVSGNHVDGKILFTIYDPAGEVVSRYTKTEGLFRINTTSVGTYAFLLSNVPWQETKYVTFGVAVGDDTYLTVAHVNDFDENVRAIAKMTRHIHAESHYLWGRQKGQMARVETSVSWIFRLCIFELAVMLGIVGFEMHFLKALVANRYLF